MQELQSNHIGWDPLEHNISDIEMISSSAKRSIRNILKSYVGSFDPFSELIQNAMDAVDKREMEERNDSDYRKELWLTIDLKENTFTIVDNGVGFREGEFKRFLAPSISFKQPTKSRGNKGVGATYIAYGFNLLELATKGDNFQFSGEFKDGNSWLTDDSNATERSRLRQKSIVNEQFSALDRGSLFTLHFGNSNTKIRDLSWYQANTAEQWGYLLLTKTPLGAIDLRSDNPRDIDYHLSVIDKRGNSTTVSSSASYLYPHKIIAGSLHLEEVRETQKALSEQGKSSSVLPKKMMDKNGIYDIYSTERLLNFKSQNLTEELRELIKRHEVTAYGYFGYSTALYDAVNDEKAKLRKGIRFLRGGMQLANNSMVQGDPYVIPLTSNTGYQNQTHIVIHFVDAEPDLGRKGFQPELKELAEVLSVSIVGLLKGWRELLKPNKGNKVSLIQEADMFAWLNAVQEHERDSPLTINNPNFFKPINEISIASTPKSEQDVIVLFSQLLAGGVIRGIKLLSTSQYKQYDGLYKFVVEEPIENHVYDATINPLGVDIENCQTGTRSIPKVLEYKHSLDGLIEEFETGEKRAADVSLAIAWDAGVQWRRNYSATSYLDDDNIHLRIFHGITHNFYDNAGGAFDAILLKDLVQYLNEHEESQSFQKSEYSEEAF